MLRFLLQRNPVCCMNTSTKKLEHAFLVGLAIKEGYFFAGQALGIIMIVQFPLLILSHDHKNYQTALWTCHRVDGIPYEKDILSKHIKLELMY